MDDRVWTATWQAGVLGGLSSILGQLIACYQSNRPLSLNTTEIAHFVLYSLIVTPPNFAWQMWLEEKFPGHTKPTNTSSKPGSTEKKSSQNEKSTPPYAEEKLNIPNTIVKFLLDQTLGAAINTVLFIAGMDMMKGKPVEVVVQDCRDSFVPWMIAGYKVWPAVSISSFLVVPVQHRTTFGSIFGLFWGVYCSLMTTDQG